MVNNQLIPKSLPAVDLLNSPAVIGYFDVKECDLFYSTINLANNRRDFHPKLISAGNNFLNLTSDEPSQILVTDIMSRIFRENRDECSIQAWIKEVSRYNPNGYKLLKMTPSLSLKELKQNYKFAALKHHPDRGGKQETMVALNEAYTELHALIIERDLPYSTTLYEACGNTIQSCSDYRHRITRLLFFAHIEDWNLDEAFQHLNSLISQQWNATRYIKALHRKIELVDVSRKFIGQLMLANLVDKAKYTYNVLLSGVEAAIKKGLVENYFDKVLHESQEFLSGNKKFKVFVNHPIQADNLLKYQIIDTKRYRNFLKKYNDEIQNLNTKDEENRKIFEDRINKTKFINNLPSDVFFMGKVVQQKTVPQPGYFVTRISALSNDQQAEYFLAFGENSQWKFVCKYIYVRLHSLLESAIRYDSHPGFESLIDEALFISHINIGNSQRYALSVANTIQFLDSLNLDDLKERIQYLRHDATYFDALDGDCFEMIQWPLIKLKQYVDEHQGNIFHE